MVRRNGFTLVEMLVVIAIIGILLGLLLPAVQAARESARRAHCANNLKQIGIALQAYHAAHGTFPMGNYAQTAGVCPGSRIPGVDAPSEDRANWMILILPYLEQQAVHNAYDFEKCNEAPENEQVRETFVDTYVCPSDTAAGQPIVPALGPGAAWAFGVGYMPGSYRGVSGRSDGNWFLDWGLQAQDYPRAWRGPLHVVGVSGFFEERTADVKDGVSNTLMVGESTTRTSPPHHTLWAYSYAFYSLSSTTPQARTLCGDYQRCRQEPGEGLVSPCRRGWGSNHHGGLNFLVCDASVRFLKQTIDEELFADLGTIAGGESAELPP
ncbi:MAG: DUF1559 domain-containing protein [Pirellulales bacterium]|nr:DUF1559 domain-containing protein [Pirellulales bacterium]